MNKILSMLKRTHYYVKIVNGKLSYFYSSCNVLQTIIITDEVVET